MIMAKNKKSKPGLKLKYFFVNEDTISEGHIPIIYFDKCVYYVTERIIEAAVYK